MMRKKDFHVTLQNSATIGLGLEQRTFQDRSVRKKGVADVSGITEEEFGKYWIKAGVLSGTCVARAFPKPPAKTQTMIADAVGDTPEKAIRALKELLEERDGQRIQMRRLEENSGTYVPAEWEYVEALQQVSFSDAQVAMLKALTIAGKEGLTIGQLTNAADYKSREVTVKAFKSVGIMVSEYLAPNLSETRTARENGEAHVVAYSHIGNTNEPATWIMHPELRDAVRAVLGTQSNA
ncbi:hypothetical protein [uncultured Ruegeria sp.]|uniref:hypothetical protein n=1 Tax=uncultured Ruegeria sp. TaxID=259304 RepID=UPI002603FC58|nr:hypothetical protein [uncultured Ruegeria sp.]